MSSSRPRAPAGMAARLRWKASMGTRRTCTRVSATMSTGKGRPSKADAASSQNGPSTAPSWWRRKPSSSTPRSTRPLSRCNTVVSTSLRLRSTSPGAMTSVSAGREKRVGGSMEATVPCGCACGIEPHQNRTMSPAPRAPGLRQNTRKLRQQRAWMRAESARQGCKQVLHQGMELAKPYRRAPPCTTVQQGPRLLCPAGPPALFSPGITP